MILYDIFLSLSGFCARLQARADPPPLPPCQIRVSVMGRTDAGRGDGLMPVRVGRAGGRTDAGRGDGLMRAGGTCQG